MQTWIWRWIFNYVPKSFPYLWVINGYINKTKVRQIRPNKTKVMPVMLLVWSAKLTRHILRQISIIKDGLLCKIWRIYITRNITEMYFKLGFPPGNSPFNGGFANLVKAQVCLRILRCGLSERYANHYMLGLSVRYWSCGTGSAVFREAPLPSTPSHMNAFSWNKIMTWIRSLVLGYVYSLKIKLFIWKFFYTTVWFGLSQCSIYIILILINWVYMHIVFQKYTLFTSPILILEKWKL